MQNRVYFSAVLLVTGCLLCCGGSAEIEKRISALESSRDELSSQVLKANLKVSFLELRLKFLANEEEGSLDPAEKGFAVVKANNGHFLVTCDDVAPYGDGQKVTIRIANPYNMTFNGFSIAARYGPRAPAMPSGADSETSEKWSAAYDTWQKSLREKQLSLTDDLRPGRWNRVVMILAPAKADEVGFIGIKISTDRVTLYGP